MCILVCTKKTKERIAKVVETVKTLTFENQDNITTLLSRNVWVLLPFSKVICTFCEEISICKFAIKKNASTVFR